MPFFLLEQALVVEMKMSWISKAWTITSPLTPFMAKQRICPTVKGKALKVHKAKK